MLVTLKFMIQVLIHVNDARRSMGGGGLKVVWKSLDLYTEALEPRWFPFYM